MAGNLGREVRFYFGGNSPADEILGVREKGLTVNGEPVDITSDENSGVRTLLENAEAEKQIDISISGVVKDFRMRAAKFAGQVTQPCELNYPDGARISGTFHLSSYEEGQPYGDAITFNATLMSAGAITYTEGS